MLKLFILFALTVFIFIQTAPAYCSGVSRTTVFHLSVTIPEHVIVNTGSTSLNPYAHNPYQLAQTQTVIRNNRTVSLTSIVVP